MMNEKIDSREVYGDDGLRIDCDCNMERACNECVDGGLYDGSTVQPQPLAVEPWNEEDERAMHALTHCENEQECRFCNGALPPSELQVDGPKSCPKYYQSCLCLKCEARDRWYKTEAT